MDLRCYLAMTSTEFQFAEVLPPYIAWMACHFSSYGIGLSNIPTGLPRESILILNDRTPIHEHDPQQILSQLQEYIEANPDSRILLDFQRPDSPETARVTKLLTEQLSCPIAVTPPYAAGLSCCVFLPPPPLHVPLSQYISYWKDREIWLEAALENQQFTVTTDGSHSTSQPFQPLQLPYFSDDALCCNYKIDIGHDHAKFTLSRDSDMLKKLLTEANALGISTAIGLYQQLQNTETIIFSCQLPSDCL